MSDPLPLSTPRGRPESVVIGAESIPHRKSLILNQQFSQTSNVLRGKLSGGCPPSLLRRARIIIVDHRRKLYRGIRVFRRFAPDPSRCHTFRETTACLILPK